MPNQDVQILLDYVNSIDGKERESKLSFVGVLITYIEYGFKPSVYHKFTLTILEHDDNGFLGFST